MKKTCFFINELLLAKGKHTYPHNYITDKGRNIRCARHAGPRRRMEMIKVCSYRSKKGFSKLTYELNFERSWEEVPYVEKNIPCNTTNSIYKG